MEEQVIAYCHAHKTREQSQPSNVESNHSSRMIVLSERLAKLWSRDHDSAIGQRQAPQRLSPCRLLQGVHVSGLCRQRTRSGWYAAAINLFRQRFDASPARHLCLIDCTGAGPSERCAGIRVDRSAGAQKSCVPDGGGTTDSNRSESVWHMLGLEPE